MLFVVQVAVNAGSNTHKWYSFPGHRVATGTCAGTTADHQPLITQHCLGHRADKLPSATWLLHQTTDNPARNHAACPLYRPQHNHADTVSDGAAACHPGHEATSQLISQTLPGIRGTDAAAQRALGTCWDAT